MIKSNNNLIFIMYGDTSNYKKTDDVYIKVFLYETKIIGKKGGGQATTADS